jgi:hypothetical protein
LEGGPPRFRQGFTCPVLLRIPLGRLEISHTGLSPTMATLSRVFCYLLPIPRCGPTTPESKLSGLGSSRFARRYSGNLFRFLFLRVLRCFNSPRSPHTPMYSVYDTPKGVGFPIRTLPDRSLLTSSPRNFAGSHVLHRRSAPRHPPQTLVRLINATLKHLIVVLTHY